MEDGLGKKGRDLFLFIFCSLFLIGIIPIFYSGPFLHIGVLFQSSIALYFFKKKLSLLGPTLFFLLLSLSFIKPLIPSVWTPNLIISIALYLIIIFSFNPLKRETHWLECGHVDKLSIFYILLLILISSGSLILWCRIFKPDLSKYAKIIPNVSLGLLITGIIAFSLFNGIAEEIMFRGIFWDGLEKLLNSVILIVLLQSLFFGLRHYEGFPSGITGIVLSFIYGGFLGFLKLRSKGLLAPILAHIFTDIAISIIILKTIGRV